MSTNKGRQMKKSNKSICIDKAGTIVVKMKKKGS